MSDPYPNTPSTTLKSLGTNVKRIYLEKQKEIFGKKRHAMEIYQDGKNEVRVDYFLRYGVVLIMKVINPGYGQTKISKFEKLELS